MSHGEPNQPGRVAAPHPVLDKYHASDADRAPLDVLRQSGVADVERRVMAGLLSEYSGTRPR